MITNVLPYFYGSQCMCVRTCVYNTITFESFDVGSFSHIRHISRGYGSSSYMKVKVKVTGAKKA